MTNQKLSRKDISSLEEKMEKLDLEKAPLVLRQTTEKTEITVAMPATVAFRAESPSSGESSSRSRSRSPVRRETRIWPSLSGNAPDYRAMAGAGIGKPDKEDVL